MTHQLFRSEAVEHHRQRLLGEVVLTQPPTYRAVVGVLLVLVVAAVLALFVGQFARTERVQGYLRPTGGFVEITAAEPGVVQAVSIRDGDHVRSGQPLLQLGTQAFLPSGGALAENQLQQLEKQLGDLKRGLAQNEKQQALEAARVNRRRRHLESQLKKLRSRRAIQEEIIALAREQVSVLEGLLEKGHGTARDLREYQTRELDARQTRTEIESSITDTLGDLDELESEARRRQLQLAQERTQLELRRSDILQRRAEVEKSGSVVMRAPIAGRVTALRAHTGQSVQPTKPLMAILPEGHELEAELLVPTRKVGRLREGMPAKLRYRAFPHRRYGVYEGRVTTIARSPLDPKQNIFAPLDASEPVYPVHVALDQQSVAWDGRDFPLQAGMILEADVIIEREALWRVLFSAFTPKG